MIDRRKEFEEKIAPRLDELEMLCGIYKIPFFATCCYEDSEEGTSYMRYMASPMSMGIKLHDDQIRHHINVSNGFDTIPHNGSGSYDAILEEYEQMDLPEDEDGRLDEASVQERIKK